MTVIDKPLLRSFRAMACELCGRRPACGHHVLARGHGGAFRLDLRVNLLAVCAEHHTWLHGRGGEEKAPTRSDLWRLIAKREKAAYDVEAVVWCVSRIPNRATLGQIEIAMEGLGRRERAAVLAIVEGQA